MVNFSLLFKYNLIFSSFLFSCFLIYNHDYTVISFILTLLGAISSAAILYILLYILMVLFSFLGKPFLYIIGLAFTFVNIGIIVDFFIYRLYSFHINAMVLNILTSPSALDSIQLGIVPFIAVSIFILIIILIQFFIISSLLKQEDEIKRIKNKKLNSLIILPLISVVLIEKFSYGFASLFTKNEILSSFKVIPLYQPLTFNRIATKYFDFKIEEQVKNVISTSAALNYPLNKIEYKKDLKKVNIILITVDSLNNLVINEEVTPNLMKFKKDAYTFNNHYSGGNATRFGIFSMMYGINSTYWFPFLNANKGAVLFDILKDLDYRINIVTSTDANWPEFRKTAYVNILDSIYDKFDGVPWEKDTESTKKAIELINKDTEKPQFTFLFLDAPHGYSFPKEYNKFAAKDEKINYLTIDKNSKDLSQIKATYKNAAYYDDKLFEDVLKNLKEKNIYDESLIIFTADHGEEFYEQGFFGHNSAFTKTQVNTPFIIKFPKSDTKYNINLDKLTSHNDIVPTILNYIGINNKSSDYSNGFNLLNKEVNREYVFSANWNNNAIITKDKTYIFSNLPNKMFKNEVRDSATYQIVDNKKNRIDTKILLNVMNENRNFLK